jgi:hypothetical protein
MTSSRAPAEPTSPDGGSSPDYDPRLAPILAPDSAAINWIELGRLEQARRTGAKLTAAESEALEAILSDPQAAPILTAAAAAYERHLEDTIREQGGTIVARTVRFDSGERRTTTRVRSFKGTPRGRAELRQAAPQVQTVRRAHGERRPGGATSSSRRSS